MREAKPGDETVELPLLLGGELYWKQNNWMDDYVSILAGDRDKPESWRLGFVSTPYFRANKKVIDGQEFITLPKLKI